MTDINLSSFIWSVADLLRGDYKQSEYGRVILPFAVLRRLDCVLAPTKNQTRSALVRKEAAGTCSHLHNQATPKEWLRMRLTLRRAVGLSCSSWWNRSGGGNGPKN